MKISILLLAFSLCFTSWALPQKSKSFLPSPRSEKIINSDWTFNYFPSETASKGYESETLDDSKWTAVSIPHTWNTFETTGKLTSDMTPGDEVDVYWLNGWGWYRKHFQVNSDITGKRVFVEFEGVREYCKVWVNGSYAGDHTGAYGSFDFDITPFIRQGNDNVIAVAVTNKLNDELKTHSMSSAEAGVYGGIYRSVRIVLKNSIYIPMQGSSSHEGGTYITTPGFAGGAGIVRIRTWVRNDNKQPASIALQSTILDASGRSVQVIKSVEQLKPGQEYMFDQMSRPVKNPALWSPANPVLYTIVTELLEGTRVTDSYTSRFGFRWFRWDEKEKVLYVNNIRTELRGAILNQDFPWLGDAVPEWITEGVIKDMAESKGVNFLRTAYYPAVKNVYDFTDTKGLIAEVGIPVTGRQDFSTDAIAQQVKEMIRRNRNHPSILFWRPGTVKVDPQIYLLEDSTRIISDQDQYLSLKNTENSQGILSGKDGGPDAKGLLKAEIVNADIKPASEPARIILSTGQSRINADRSSLAIITAKILDSKGAEINGTDNTLKWSVSGPARLTGADIYLPETSINDMNVVPWYPGFPSNIVRSNGEPGRIVVTVYSAGIASGSVEISAESSPGDNSFVSWIPLKNDGRRSSGRSVATGSLEDIPAEIKTVTGNIDLKASGPAGYRNAIAGYITRNNPAIDTSSVEFAIFTRVLETYLRNNNGQISGEDYNFNVVNYNLSRLITGYIIATKLPQQFKDGLRAYYAESIIQKGKPANAGDEMNWLNWIPSGGTVVIYNAGEKMPAVKGVVVTDKSELTDLILLVHPGFQGFSQDAKQRAVEFITKMNPFIKQEFASSGNHENLVFRAEKGKPVLIPLYKFIAE